MIRFLLLGFFFFSVKGVTAQGTATAMASVTIMQAVGTAEIEEESTSSVAVSATDVSPFFSLPSVLFQGAKTDLTRFRVVSHSFVYSIAVLPYATENFMLQKKQENYLVNVQVKPVTNISEADAFALDAEELSCSAKTEITRHAMPDVVVYFN